MINVLYDFHILIDTDFGIYKFIKTNPKLNKPSFFNPRMMALSNKDILFKLTTRRSLNPLDVFASEASVGKLDEVYKQIMGNPEYYDTILRLSKPTKIYQVYEQSEKMPNSMHNGYILYYNDTELNFLTECCRIPKDRCVRFESQMSLDKFGTIFLCRYINILQFDIPGIKGKNIYISSHPYNVDISTIGGKEIGAYPKSSISAIINSRDLAVNLQNKVSIVDIYNFEKMEDYNV